MTTGKIYTFDEQAEIGAKGEAFVKQLLLTSFGIETSPVGIEAQKLGIDFIGWRPNDLGRFAYEVKTDITAGSTGNAFLETWSNKVKGQRGWALNCCAEVLFYYVPTRGKLYHCQVSRLKWFTRKAVTKGNYRFSGARNDGYISEGLLVPIDDLVAEGILDLLIEEI